MAAASHLIPLRIRREHTSESNLVSRCPCCSHYSRLQDDEVEEEVAMSKSISSASEVVTAMF